ncbi:MAG: corrinoid protein [Bacillota bacterium]
MSQKQEKLLADLSDAVVEMDEARTEKLAQEYVQAGFDAYDGINRGLAQGMKRAGELYEQEEYYIPELLICSDAMYLGLDILKPHLESKESEQKFKVVLGVVEGDTHDIGKNLVKTMFETAGFEVFDLGRDIPPVDFIDKAVEVGADIIGLSTLMTPTMPKMEEVINILKKRGLKEQIKVMIGGGPISQSFADQIGADMYTVNASEAVKAANNLVGADN